jgi:hypothetical protein
MEYWLICKHFFDGEICVVVEFSSSIFCTLEILLNNVDVHLIADT